MKRRARTTLGEAMGACEPALRPTRHPVATKALGVRTQLSPRRGGLRIAVLVSKPLLAQEVQVHIEQTCVARSRDSVDAGLSPRAGRRIARSRDRPRVILTQSEPVGVARILRCEVRTQVLERMPSR